MRVVPLFLTTLAAAGPLAAQSFTGEFRAIGVGAFAPAVSGATGYQEPIGPPAGSPMAGVMADVSFITGRLRLGPEGIVLRGPERRVWSLGGVARYEFGTSSVRPFGVFGAGSYFWDREILLQQPPGLPGDPYGSWGSDVHLFSLSGGGGVNLGAPGGRLAATAELRFHRTFSHREAIGARTMVSLGLGGRVAW